MADKHVGRPAGKHADKPAGKHTGSAAISRGHKLPHNTPAAHHAPAAGQAPAAHHAPAADRTPAAGQAPAEKTVWRGGNMLYPLPAVMVSCARPGEVPNIITVAWAGTVCSDPAMVSVSVKPSRFSHDIIEETGEFAVNLVTEDLVRACDWCGVRSGREVDKFRECGLTPLPAHALTTAPLIAESPLSLECRVTQILRLGSHDMFLARVECVDVDSRRIDEKSRLHLNESGLIVYSHGEYYGLGKKLGTFGYSVRRKK